MTGGGRDGTKPDEALRPCGVRFAHGSPVPLRTVGNQWIPRAHSLTEQMATRVRRFASLHILYQNSSSPLQFQSDLAWN